ncbi:non-oxidative hydroxyarylic acid decarboxylases subunit D [Catenulispora rubra]|uniref:non-oxidative hydroxyarylic acid decarboxylases subunit D n=1 Tax=Catenulispora rubra TaxID=280293 RepID=UPI002263B5FB
MSCPRCTAAAEQLASSPVPGVWEILRCVECLYMWRTTEPARRTTRDAYPEAFSLTRSQTDSAK